MNQKHQIEARLERSLRHQVAAPTLDGRFNAAVWSRIAAQSQKAAPTLVMRRRRMPAWLVVSNVVGVMVTVLALGYYAVRASSGLDLGLSMPSFTAEQQLSVIKAITPYISGAAVLFGLMFTRPVRRMIASLR